MIEPSKAKQSTIICHFCGKIVDIVVSPEGNKTCYGICMECTQKRSD